MKPKVAPGQVILLPIENNEVDGFVIDGKSSKMPPNKAEVLFVGDEDEFGTPIWEVGDIVVIPSVGVMSFEYNGRLLRACHHLRIPFGYAP